MTGIFLMTIRRFRDAASFFIFILGCVFAVLMQGMGQLDILAFSESETELVGTNNVLFGTVILVGLAVLVTIFNAASEIPRDISNRLISVLLSKPISRFQYVLGKFAASLVFGAINGGIWITVLVVCRYFMTNDPIVPFTAGLVFSQYVCLLILFPITAIAICSSCIFSDVVSMIVTSAYIMLSFGVVVVPIMSALSRSGLGKAIMFVYYFFPNLGYFLQSYHSFFGVLGLAIYAGTTSLIFLLIGSYRFGNSDVYARS